MAHNMRRRLRTPVRFSANSRRVTRPIGVRGNFQVIRAPGKMLWPIHFARIKKRHDLPTDTVERVRLGMFPIVTPLAREGQICQFVPALFDPRNDVLDRVRLRRERFRAPAILALPASSPANCLFHLVR